MNRVVALLVAAAVGWAPLAQAAELSNGCAVPDQLEISAKDVARLEELTATRTLGLAAALGGSAADRKVVADIYAPGLMIVDAIPAGKYRCRTIKLGGMAPELVVYGFFACVVEAGANGAMSIVKTTGSQRFSGDLFPVEGGIVYRGALNYSDEGPIAYGKDTERDQVGCLTQSGADGSYILELPRPAFESVHDVIELVPAR